MTSVFLALLILWTPCQDPSGIDRYGVYFGRQPRPLPLIQPQDWEYENYIYIGGGNSWFRINEEYFPIGQRWYFALTCVDGAENESAYSNEIIYVRQPTGEGGRREPLVYITP